MFQEAPGPTQTDIEIKEAETPTATDVVANGAVATLSDQTIIKKIDEAIQAITINAAAAQAAAEAAYWRFMDDEYRRSVPLPPPRYRTNFHDGMSVLFPAYILGPEPVLEHPHALLGRPWTPERERRICNLFCFETNKPEPKSTTKVEDIINEEESEKPTPERAHAIADVSTIETMQDSVQQVIIFLFYTPE